MKRIFNNIVFRLKNPTCKIGNRVSISRFAKVGKNCIIHDNVTLKKNVFLGNNVVIGKNTSLVNITIGDDSVIESDVKIVGDGKGKILIGTDCYIGLNNILDSSGNITVGNFVHIAGPSTALWCHSSSQMALNRISLEAQDKYRYKKVSSIVIESCSYIGGNCTIYPGVKINTSSIIAPNSAVVKDVEPNSMMGGVPAKLIKKI